ncbi:helix-turn-helix transcriptional regulator [Xanthobacteraceae bacterium A53D]
MMMKEMKKIPVALEESRIICLAESAKLAGISMTTLRRRMNAGDGPVVVRMSTRRVGIRAGELRRWIEGLPRIS